MSLAARLVRTLVALGTLLVGVLVIYAFGAGYLSGYGLRLPSPWNVVATLVLGASLIVVVVVIVAPRRSSTKG